MTQILRAPEAFGPTITVGVYANHLVIETRNKPRQMEKRWHWCVLTPELTWQVGWALRHGVQIGPDRAGALPSEKGVKYYRDVAAALAAMYDGEHVETYRNPGYRPNGADVTNRKATTLQKITPLSRSRYVGARSRSERKAIASRENLSAVNRDREQDGAERVERFMHLRAGGLSCREIAEREGVTVNAVECALKRARRRENARMTAEAARTDELAARRATKAAREDHLNAEQKIAISNLATDDSLTYEDDGSITVQTSDGWTRRIIGGQTTDEDRLPTDVVGWLDRQGALRPGAYTFDGIEVRLTDRQAGLRLA